MSDVVLQAQALKTVGRGDRRQVMIGQTGGQFSRREVDRGYLEIELLKLILEGLSLWFLHDVLMAAIHVVEPIAGAVPWMMMKWLAQ